MGPIRGDEGDGIHLFVEGEIVDKSERSQSLRFILPKVGLVIVKDQSNQSFDILCIGNDIVIGQMMLSFLRSTRRITDQDSGTAKLKCRSIDATWSDHANELTRAIG
jgi:hypothetical protein